MLPIRHIFSSQRKNKYRLLSKCYGSIRCSSDGKKFTPNHSETNVLKSSNFGMWTKSSFYEFTEKVFVLRLEHLLEKTTFMEEVRTSRAEAMDIQTKLLEAIEKKRNIMKQLEVIRHQLNHIYRDINIGRIKDIHIDMTSEEVQNLCQSERHLCELYNQIDKEEQRLILESVLATKTANEKERNHTNFVKVVSVVGTIASSILALVVSTIIHTQNQKSLENKLSQLLGEKSPESWGSYLRKNTRWMYSWTKKLW